MTKNIIVIGRGIIGASVAFSLQSAGAQVTIVADRSERATDGSFGWINASFYNDDAHHSLRNEGLAAYKRLSQALDIPVNWNGCLCWENEDEALQEQARDLNRLGYQAKLIERREFSKLEPNIPNPPESCIYMPQEAAAESGALADALCREAVKMGAVEIASHVLRLIESEDRIAGAEIEGEILRADQVVVAAGVHTPSLVEPAGIALPMLERPAIIIKTKPVEAKFSHILVSQLGEVRQLPDGSILMPAAIGHQSYAEPAEDQDLNEATHETLERLSKFTGVDLELDWSKLAYRPVPQDGMPVVGTIKQGGYVAVMHSGITLAALMGELIAEEILTGENAKTHGWLKSYRPDRFQN